MKELNRGGRPGKSVRATKENQVLIFESRKKAGEYFGLDERRVGEYIRQGRFHNGWKLE